MSHSHRFFASFDDSSASSILLPDDEAHHARRVARLREGEAVSVFNGTGLEAVGSLRYIGTRHGAVETETLHRHAPPEVCLTIAMASLHRDKRQEDALRRAVELGASRIWVWHGDHSQRAAMVSSRWHKTLVEVCKQCGRPYLPLLETPASLDEVLSGLRGPCIMASLSTAAGETPVVTVTDSLTLLVGPEGDFSEREHALALANGAIPVNLGPRVYRSEVAAAIMLTLAGVGLGEFGSAFSVRRV